MQTLVLRNRWFDIPLTREESLQSDKKLIITFGPSQDPDGVTMVDSVKVCTGYNFFLNNVRLYNLFYFILEI